MESDSAESKQPDNLPVAVDAMGGDHGPGVVVAGCVAAAKERGIASIIVGPEKVLSQHLRDHGGFSNSNIQIQHASEVITMEDRPSRAIRTKSDASVRVAFELVKDKKAGAIVSPGNTGAMMAAGLFVSGTLRGIARPAIATLIPKSGSSRPTVFLDSGANVDCHAHQLVQFAMMGDFYARAALDCAAPRVALLSNGTENKKGNDIIRSAALALSDVDGVNFIGFVEGNDISRDVADVVVCDGFIGNIVLKTMEGSVELVVDSLKHHLERQFRGKLGLWLASPILKRLFGETLNPAAYGGAPLLGLQDIAIVCHGSSNQKAIFNAIRVARQLYRDDLITSFSQALSTLDLGNEG